LPPLFLLDNILRQCTDVGKITAACAKPADFSTSLTFARLVALQALKLLWFHTMLCSSILVAIKKREESESEEL